MVFRGRGARIVDCDAKHPLHIEHVVPLSSSCYYWAFFVSHAVLVPAWAICVVSVVIADAINNFEAKNPWPPILIVGGFFVVACVAIALVSIRFVQKFARRVEIDPEAGRVRFRHGGRLNSEPIADLLKVVYNRFGRLDYVELTFRSGATCRLFPTFFDDLDIKRWGAKSWWEGKLASARL